MNKRKKAITNAMQEVAVDILQELEIAMMTHKRVPKYIHKIYDKMFEKYKLNQDPFTNMCCTDKQFAKSYEEYAYQSSPDYPFNDSGSYLDIID